jgi:hypothetical protein
MRRFTSLQIQERLIGKISREMSQPGAIPF